MQNIDKVGSRVLLWSTKWRDVGFKIKLDILDDSKINSIDIFLLNNPSEIIDLKYNSNTKKWEYYNRILPSMVGVAYNCIPTLLDELNA